MTVSTSSTAEFNLGQICRLAYIQAGLLDVHSRLDTARAGLARDFLGLILQALPSKSRLSRTRTTVTVEVTAGSATVNLPSYVLDVNGDGAYIAPEETDLEHPTFETNVRLIDQGMWHATGNKASLGTPTRMYLDRVGETLVLRLLPIPERAGHLRLKIQKLLADPGTNANTVDLERPWSQYLVYALGANLALASGLKSQATMLEAKARAELKDCQGFSSEHVNKRMRTQHSTGWRRR